MNMKTIFAMLYIFYKVTTAQNPDPVIIIPQPPVPNIITRLNTPSPTFGYINPYCPPQQVQSIIGLPPQVIDTMSTTPNCYTPNDIAIGLEGTLQCNNYACCLCKSIQCGTQSDPCQIFVVNDHGAIGAQSIVIDGGISTSVQPIPGAVIKCSGIEACKAVNMFTRNVQRVSCDSTSSCEQANIVLSDPAPNLSIHCNGPSSCVGANIIVNIGEAPPPGMICNPAVSSKEIIMGPIAFNGDKAAQSAILTINNNGCNKVIIPSITCIYDTSCPDTQFIFNGDVTLQEFYSGISSLTCSAALECANLDRTITNPGNSFILECVLTNSCQGLKLTLDYQSSNAVYVDHVSELRFDQANAANGAIITINNNQLNAMQDPMTINTITCVEAYSCHDLTIIAGPNVDLLTTFIDCSVPDSCHGCMIQPSSMNGFALPCDYNSVGLLQAQPLPQQAPPMPQFKPVATPQIPGQSGAPQQPPPVPSQSSIPPPVFPQGQPAMLQPVVPAQPLPQMPQMPGQPLQPILRP